MECLDKRAIRRLAELRRLYDKSAVFNVALLLVGARAAYIPDTMEDDACFCSRVRDRFPDRIGLISLPLGFSILHRVGAVSASDRAFLDKASDADDPKLPRVLRRVLGYTGTAFPCSRNERALLIEWVFLDGTGVTNIANHCAHPQELKACFDEFNAMRERAKGLVGVKIGDTRLSRMAMMAAPFDWRG